jgi:hypothetical protein
MGRVLALPAIAGRARISGIRSAKIFGTDSGCMRCNRPLELDGRWTEIPQSGLSRSSWAVDCPIGICLVSTGSAHVRWFKSSPRNHENLLFQRFTGTLQPSEFIQRYSCFLPSNHFIKARCRNLFWLLPLWPCRRPYNALFRISDSRTIGKPRDGRSELLCVTIVRRTFG